MILEQSCLIGASRRVGRKEEMLARTLNSTHLAFGTAEEFLSKARQIIEDDDLFQEFSAQYLADSEESMKQLEESTDDGNLIEQLKRLQIATSPARPQGPRQTAL